MTYIQPQRASYPLDEAMHPWLKMLLDAYCPADLGVHEGVARETGKGRQLACVIHTLRPMACRNFNVFNQACAPGEDAFHARRQDVLTPIRSCKDMALEISVPFYGKVTQSERKKRVQSGRLDQLARAMRNGQWQSLADKVNPFDRKKG